ncbi:hypothetical protein E4U17_003072 [Claviceps sp. LM77 group G4]|nr:hypothetical protein E4U17_003072 [Claviceps sp. LM77 group G4]KAG6080468.1 hypothetical protein E4U16_000315 [Claviceps sp. LM84 group G4]
MSPTLVSFPFSTKGGSGQGVDREGATANAIDLSGWLGSHCVDPMEIDSGKKVLTSAGGPKDHSAGQQDNTLRTPSR